MTENKAEVIHLFRHEIVLNDGGVPWIKVRFGHNSGDPYYFVLPSRLLTPWSPDKQHGFVTSQNGQLNQYSVSMFDEQTRRQKHVQIDLVTFTHLQGLARKHIGEERRAIRQQNPSLVERLKRRVFSGLRTALSGEPQSQNRFQLDTGELGEAAKGQITIATELQTNPQFAAVFKAGSRYLVPDSGACLQEDAVSATVGSDGSICLVATDGVGGTTTPKGKTNKENNTSRFALEVTKYASRFLGNGYNFSDMVTVVERQAAEITGQYGGAQACMALASIDPQSRRLDCANIGDARVYILRGGQLLQQTVDHSLVALLVGDGTIKPQEADAHPNRNVVTKTLGVMRQDSPSTKIVTVGLQKDDVVIVCTDGVTHDSYTSAAMHQALRRAGENPSAAKVAAALNTLTYGDYADNAAALIYKVK